jgi:DNA-binding beta-propeller fold protein YncE
VAPDGTVYVADTWNHRIQVFTASGEFLRTWGEPGQGAEPYGLFGPRDVAVSVHGLVYVSDTGNNRIVAYTAEGNYVAEIGGAGDQLGQFSEPVGLAYSEAEELYVADEGNRRVQVLSIAEDGSLHPKSAWPVDAWPHNEMLYKPYLCVVGDRVFVTDTEAAKVLEYTTGGEQRATYDLNATGVLNYGLVYGIAAQADGSLWVSDHTGAGVLVRIIPGP